MVGKSTEAKSSRIFYQCYLKCCKLQNLTPLNNVIPSENGKALNFCVDRIKYADWAPILNALSCDLSLHSVSIRCRQQVKTVLEHIDCERLAKTVNKRSVVLTNFMLTNLVEAISQLLSNTTLLNTLLFEGLPLKIPYLNPLCEALLVNNSLSHLFLPRCLLGDAGCLAVCKAVRCLPNILTLDLSGSDLTAVGAGYIAELVKYQKIHRYSENWIHTLRYRLPDLDTMAGLRRITLCANQQLGDVGVMKLLDILSDDLWIKALDIQNCGLREQTANDALEMMQSNKTLVVLDLRHNPEISSESLSKVRAALRENERAANGQVYSWLGNLSGCSSDAKSVKSVPSKNGIVKDRMLPISRNAPTRYNATKSTSVKKEKDYTELLEEQLKEEISHRQQLEELNFQLVDQMKQLKQQQMRLWANGATSSGSEQSFQASSRSGDLSASSSSSSSVPIDQNTLSYIQQAFKDIYAFIKNNQCHGQCYDDMKKSLDQKPIVEEVTGVTEIEDYEETEMHVNIIPKKVQSSHLKITEAVKSRKNKTTKSAHLLRDHQYGRDKIETKLEMIERQMGDTKNSYNENQCMMEELTTQNKVKKSVFESPCSSVVSSSSDTLVCSPQQTQRSINPRDALCSSDDEDSS